MPSIDYFVKRMIEMNLVKGRISVVIPCYNAEKNIEQVVSQTEDILRDNHIEDYEFVLVNDASRDDTFSVIRRMAEEKACVTALDLAKNSGQHGALMAGFHYVTGEYVVTCEDDGQTQMQAIGTMLNKLQEGYDVVAAKYMQRPQTSFLRRIGRRMARSMAAVMMPRPKGISVPIFFLARRFVIDEMTKYEHSYPYVTGLLLRTTHNIANVEVEQQERISGSTGYTFRKLVRLWLNGFTAFSILPLRIATFMGFFVALIGIAYAILIVFRRFVFNDVVAGWSSLISITLVMSGLMLCVMGMIGEYVGRIYMCINHTPQYVLRSVTHGQDREGCEGQEETDEAMRIHGGQSIIHWNQGEEAR